MQKIAFGNLAAAMSYLGGAVKMMQINRTLILQGKVLHQSIDLPTYTHMVKSVEAIRDAAGAMTMTATSAATERAHNALMETYRQHGHFGSEELARLIDPVIQSLSVFRDELDKKLVVALTSRHADLFESEGDVFGHAVGQAFPDATEDLSEAANCLVLGRATACVFHLMRAMEYSVQRLSTHLAIPNPSREWGKLLSDIAKAIEVMPKGDIRIAWSESHSHLYHVKQAWRNDVMHPNKSYSLNEAEQLFEAVRAYLSQLANLLK